MKLGTARIMGVAAFMIFREWMRTEAAAEDPSVPSGWPI